MVEFVLPLVPYRQLVFTIPIALRKAFLLDRSLYGELCRVAYACTLDYMRERAPLPARQSRAVPAMVVSPQSYGDLIVPHAHTHSVVSLGLFRRDGRYFPMPDIDFSGLQELFRQRFFQMMLKKERILPETVERFLSWEHSGFHVNSDRKLEADDRAGLEGLLCYIERPCVSLRRLTYRGDGMVHYQGTKFHPRLGIDHQLVTPVEFLAMLIPHIALKYEVRIRSYGALSTTFRGKAGWIERPPVDAPPPLAMVSPSSTPGLHDESRPTLATLSPARPQKVPDDCDSDSEFIRRRKRGWAKLISKTWKDDPGVCRHCGHRMKVIAAIGPDQPDVIERILRHLNRWDPPWLRQRKARGPPPATGPPERWSGESEFPQPIDPVIDDELYVVDPPFDEDSPT